MKESEDEADEGGLAGAGFADDSRGRAGTEVKTELIENLMPTALVGKRDIGHADSSSIGEENRIALVLKGRLLEFHDSFGRGEGGDDGRDDLREGADRSLDLADELDEGQHHTVGDGTRLEVIHTPDESNEVTDSKTSVYSERTKGRELRAMDNLAAKESLGVRQLIDHAGRLLEGLEDHAMLEALLKDRLNLTVRVADVAVELAHHVDVGLTDDEEEGRDADEQEGEHGLHGVQENERPDESEEGANEARNSIRDDAGNRTGICDKTVHRIARMVLFAAGPLGVHEAREDSQLHEVLTLHAQDGTYPAVDEGQEKVEEHEGHDERHAQPEGGLRGMRGRVDGHLCGPDEAEVDSHVGHAHQHVDERAEADALGRVPEPTEDGTGRDFIVDVKDFTDVHSYVSKL